VTHERERPNPYRAVTDQPTLRELLQHTYDEAAAVRKFDQQLIYAPLGAAVAAVYSVASNRAEFLATQPDRLLIWLCLAAVLVTALVGLGLSSKPLPTRQDSRAPRRPARGAESG